MNIRNIIIYLCVALTATHIAYGQLNLNRYHMENRMVLGQGLNASYFPKSKFYISLPAIANFGFDVNSPVSYSDLFEKTGDSVRVKLGEYLNNEENEYLSLQGNLPILGFGFRINEKSNASFFVNNRLYMVMGIPKDLARLAYNGNGRYLGTRYEIDDLDFDSYSYAEIGAQYTRDFMLFGRKLTGGVRAKYLTGLAMASLRNAQVNITTDPNTYRTTIEFEEATLRTAGIDLDADDGIDEGITEGELGGGGFAIDLGGQWQFNDKWGFNLAINDLGFINWNGTAKEVRIINQTYVLEGVDIESDDFGEAIEEQFDDAFETDTIDANFTRQLVPTVYMGTTYKVGENGYASATWGYTFDLSVFRNALGIGYTHTFGRVLTLSSTVSKRPQQPVNLGVGMGLNAGPVQLHMIADGLLGYTDLAKARGVNFGFGINFIFGNPDKAKVESAIPEEYLDNTSQ